MPITVQDYIDSLTEQRRQNPNFRLPPGYRWDGTRVVRGFTPGARVGGVPGAGSPGQINIPLGGGEGGGGGGTPTIGTGPGYVDGFPGGVLPGTPTGMPTPPSAPTTGSGQSAPRTGGNSILNWLSDPSNWGNILSMLGDTGSVLGSTAQGAASGRAAEANMLAQRDIAGVSQYGINQNAEMAAGNLDLNRQQFQESARGNRASDALRGDLIANMQDANISVPGVPAATVTGGLRPSAMSANGRAAGAELNRQAMLAQLDPPTYAGGRVLTPPPLSEIPKPSGLETAAGAGGSILSILGALAPLLGGRGRTPTTTPPKTVGG
jgi:hypothetical protein